MTRRLACSVAAMLFLAAGAASAQITETQLDQAAKTLAPQVISWRRDFHQNPELGNRETRTAAAVAAHLKSLGLEVKTGIAHTGVVGVLKGGKPGPVIALRADMDARLKIDAIWREGNPAPGLRRVIDEVLQTFAHDVALNPG